VQVAQYGMSWETLRAAALQAEDMGADLLVNWDHFFGPGPDSEAAHFECWTTLAAWAQTTSRIEIGPLVTSVGYRNPDLVADMARTIDHISGGRFLLGVGAGFKARDYVEYGFEFGTVGSRISMLADHLARIRARLARLEPPPVRRIPLLVGGSGEQKTLRIVAEYADIWHTFAEGEDFARKSRVLDGYCGDIGRDPAEIERSVLVAGDPRDRADQLRELGATLFIVKVEERPQPDLGTAKPWLEWRDRVNAG